MSSTTIPLSSDKLLNSKTIAFMSIMSALGVVLAFLSVYSLPIGPGVAVDLSHIGTYIVALSGGPIMGSIAAAIAGLIPAFRFANPAIIPGKMLTGFTVGFLYYIFINKIGIFKRSSKSKIVAMLIAGLVGYFPEMIFTIWDLNMVMGFPEAVVIEILIKAWIEIAIISFLISVILNIENINNLISDLIGEQGKINRLEVIIFAIIIDASMILFMLLFIPSDIYSNLWGWTFTTKTELEYFMWIVGLAILLAGLITYGVYDLKTNKSKIVES